MKMNRITKAGLLATAVALASCGGKFETGDGGTPGGLTVKVYAGSLQGPGSRDGSGTAAQFNEPRDVAQDAAGNVYVADSASHTIRKITPQGAVSTLAGSAGEAGSADGTGTAARFTFPAGVAATDDGTVYVSDTGNHTLRRITPQGVVTTVAGSRGQAGNTDGVATVARFSAPGKLAVDQDGTLYVAANYAVRKMAPDGTVSTFAGKSGEQGLAAGNGPQARFAYPVSVALGGGNVFVAQGSNITSLGGGDVRKFSRQGLALPYGANPNGVVAVSAPVDIAADSQGNVFVAANGADQTGPGVGSTYRSIEMIAADGRSRATIAGATSDVRTVDGPGTSARFMDPQAIATGPGGRLVVAETATNAVRAIDGGAARTVTTLAGGAAGGYVDGSVAAARFNGPSGLSAAPDGTLLVADTRNDVLRRISPAGAVSTVAVTFAGGGGFNLPTAVAAGAGTTVYALDAATAAGRQVNAIDSAGRATRFYATGPNAATIAADAAGNLYVGEAGQLTVVTPAGSARVLAAGISAQGLAGDSAGNVYFSDNGTVGVVDPAGRVTVRAGRAGLTGDVNGTGGDARFNRPGALALDAAGNLYVADGLKIRKVTPQGVVTALVDVSTLDGVHQLANGGQAPAVNGLAWVAGTLYGIVQNAVISIAPVL